MRAIALLFILAQSLFSRAQAPVGYEPTRQEGYYYTNPLLDCEPNLTYLPPFKKDVTDYIEQQINDNKATRISVSFKQLNHGYSFGINEYSKFTPASLLKVAVAMFVMKKAEQNPNVLDEKEVFEKYVFEFPSDSRLVIGKSYRVKDLIFQMLVYSDNEAKFLLQKHFSHGFMWKDVFNEIGIVVNIGAAQNNIVSPKDYSRIFKVLYNASYLNRKNSSILLKILSRTTFKDGILAGIQDTAITIANKFGFRELKDRCQLHECAVVYLPGNPYLLMIMTEGTNSGELKHILGNISSIVYKSCQSDSSRKSTDIQASESLMNPLLECSSDIEMVLPFRQKVLKSIDSSKSDSRVVEVSVYFKQLKTGHSFTVNEDQQYSPASTMKIALAMSVLKEVEKKPELLAQKFGFHHSVFSTLQNITDSTISVDKEYSVNELLERSLIYSDNLAADLLSEKVPNFNRAWYRTFTELGLRHLTANGLESGSGDIMHVQELSLFFRVLYNATFLNREYSEKLLEILSKTRYDRGIRSGVSDPNIIVTSKFGERVHESPKGIPSPMELHDGGIVYFEGSPYVLCVMTKGYDFDAQAKAISDVSEVIFNEMLTQFPPE